MIFIVLTRRGQALSLANKMNLKTPDQTEDRPEQRAIHSEVKSRREAAYRIKDISRHLTYHKSRKGFISLRISLHTDSQWVEATEMMSPIPF